MDTHEEPRKRQSGDDPESGLVIGPTTGDADVQLTFGRTSRTGGRPDAVITNEIERRFAASSLADHGIQVAVDHATVTLRGPVRDDAEKHLAEHLAESVGGVRAVESELWVVAEPGDRPDPRAG
jgi:osmotically-inducible protein OsmY